MKSLVASVRGLQIPIITLTALRESKLRVVKPLNRGKINGTDQWTRTLSLRMEAAAMAAAAEEGDLHTSWAANQSPADDDDDDDDDGDDCHPYYHHYMIIMIMIVFITITLLLSLLGWLLVLWWWWLLWSWCLVVILSWSINIIHFILNHLRQLQKHRPWSGLASAPSPSKQTRQLRNDFLIPKVWPFSKFGWHNFHFQPPATGFFNFWGSSSI